MEKKFRKSRKEKPYLISTEKKTLSGKEDELIVSIPPLGRLSVVAIQPEPDVAEVQVEHARAAAAIGICMQCHLYHHQFSLLNAKEIQLNIIWDLKSTNTTYQVDSFLKENTYPPQKALAVCALNMCQLERFQKAVTV